MEWKPRTTLLPGLVLALVACGGAEDAVTDIQVTTSLVPAPSTTPAAGSSTMPDLDSNQSAIVEVATHDLAARLDVEPDEVVLVSFRAVTWPDGSLGCPEEGEMYTQAVVEGYQIGLRHDDRFFDYHGAVDGDPFLCPSAEKDGGLGFVPPPGFDSES